MEPRPNPTTISSDSGPFSPGDIVAAVPRKAPSRLHSNWLDEIGTGVVEWCRLGRVGPNPADWTIGVRMQHKRNGQIIRARYLARYLRLVRAVHHGPSWPNEPWVTIERPLEAMKASEV
jgi:hypothetical protein